MCRRFMLLLTVLLSVAPAALAATPITHHEAMRVERAFEAHGLGGRVLGCKVLKSHRRAVCRVDWFQYTWLDVVTRDGGCTPQGRRVGPNTYRVVVGLKNCYTGPVLAEHVAYSIELRSNYAGPGSPVLR